MFKYREYVYAVYREGSFSKAAAKMNLSQPALSATIKKAEAQFGYPIFDRKTLPVSLTEYGVQYLNAVEQIYNIQSDLEHSLSDIETLRTGEITIGTNHVYASLLFPGLISMFNAAYPKVKIRLLEGAAVSNEERLLNGTLDLLLDNRSEDGPASIRRITLGTETLLLAAPTERLLRHVPADHILSFEDVMEGVYASDSCPTVSLSLFAEEPFVLLTEGNDTRLRSDQIFREVGIPANAIIEVEQMATAYLILEKNQQFSLISDTLIRRSHAESSLSFCKLASRYAARGIFFSYQNKQYVKKVITEFLRFAQENPSWLRSLPG